jgi:hypothetical protein
MIAATCVDWVRPSPFGSCDFGQLLLLFRDFGQLLVHFMNPVLGTASEGLANYSFLLGQLMIQSTGSRFGTRQTREKNAVFGKFFLG